MRERILMASRSMPNAWRRLGTLSRSPNHRTSPVHRIFSVSEDGVLAYQTGAGETGSQLTWFDRTGKPIGSLGDMASIVLCFA
jgi:hypothetical protein